MTYVIKHKAFIELDVRWKNLKYQVLKVSKFWSAVSRIESEILYYCLSLKY